MVNLITRMVSEEIIWRQRGEWYFSRRSLVKLVWRLSGVSVEKKWSIKSPDNLHTNLTIKSL